MMQTQPAEPRRSTVPRTGLLERLEASSAVPVVTVVAPPGYGKTTLLRQWAERDPRPFSWLSLAGRGGDPTILLADAGAVFHRGAPGVLVLDDAHLVPEREGLDDVVELARHLRGAWQVVLAGRADLPVAMARLRAEGGVVEIGPGDLAMDQDEASSLLRRVGVGISEAEVAELTRRTEGWPAALYLSGLSLRTRSGRRHGPAARPDGGRFVVDYLQSVLLERLDGERLRFLTRTAVLDRLCGPLCDAVLERSSSGELLDSLERSELLLVPLDRNRHWYRHHRLLRELLRSELERREPGLAAELAGRAARWCERNGLPEDAVEYGIRAGDADRVARLILEIAFAVYHQGRAATLRRWLDWFEDRRLLRRYPGVAMLSAWTHLLAGRPETAERWAVERAAGGFLRGALPDGSGSLDGWLAVLRAATCRHGAERMGRDAAIALDRLPVSSPWRAAALLLQAISRWLTGDRDGADAVLAHAAEAAEDLGATETAAMALAERAALAMDRDDWSRAASLARRASSMVRHARLHGYASNTLLHAVGARLAIRRGDLTAAREDLLQARRLWPRCRALPFYGVQTGLELIRAYTALMDVRGAKDLLREVDDALRRCPDPGVLRERTDELASRLDTIRSDVVLASPLTAAELRLLPQLATHCSFREIGERLDLSPHTVKTQAISIYRRLGVSSRSRAIQRAQDLGLLPEPGSAAG